MYDSVSNQSMCKVEVMATDNDKTGPAKKFCDHGVSGKFPTNLKGHCHLKKHHPDEYEEVRQNEEKAKKAAKAKAEISATKTFGPQKQLTISEALQGKCEYDRNSEWYKNITKKLAVFVGSSIVENVKFQQFIKSLDSRYPLPSRTLLGKELDKVLVDLKANIHTYLAISTLTWLQPKK